MHKPILPILLAGALLLAGCTETGDDDEEISTAAISADGDTQDSAQCSDGEATITGGGTVDEGSMTVTVTDGDGNEVWSETYDDAFELEGETVDGTGGTWTISGTDGAAFDGDFGLNLVCS